MFLKTGFTTFHNNIPQLFMPQWLSKKINTVSITVQMIHFVFETKCCLGSVRHVKHGADLLTLHRKGQGVIPDDQTPSIEAMDINIYCLQPKLASNTWLNNHNFPLPWLWVSSWWPPLPLPAWPCRSASHQSHMDTGLCDRPWSVLLHSMSSRTQCLE